MIDIDSVDDYLRRLLPGVPRAGPNAIEIPPPYGVLGLVALGQTLTLRHDHSEAVKAPIRTLKDGGGDWEDITLLLMAAAGPKGFGTRVHFNGRAVCLQAFEGLTGEWTTIGPHALLVAGGTEDEAKG